MVSVTLNDLSVQEQDFGTTKALIRGIVHGIREQCCTVGGFDAYVISDVPGGSGLSSSACFEVLIGTAVNGLFTENTLDMEAIARIQAYVPIELVAQFSEGMDKLLGKGACRVTSIRPVGGCEINI